MPASRQMTVDSKYTTKTNSSSSSSSNSHLPTTILQKLVCPARYQGYLSMFLYDFFITNYRPDGGVYDAGLQLPSTACKLFMTDECVSKDGGIPIDELREYAGETDSDVEYRLKRFPVCRYVAEQISSYKVMSYERTLRTITVILEINIDVMFRQCHLFLCTNDRTKQLYTTPFTSLRVSTKDVGRMFVEAWRDYTLQCCYGRTYPTYLHMFLESYTSTSGFNIVDYYHDYLTIDGVVSDNMIFDFYAFESDDVKKGTNVSRLIGTLRQLEIGDHVCPGYMPVFKTMYSSYIDEPLKFLKLQHDYRSIVVVDVTTATTMDSAAATALAERRRGRKHRNPSKIIDDYGKEHTRRQMWYNKHDERRQQQQQQQQYNDDDDGYDIDNMLNRILQSIDSTAAASAAAAAASVYGSGKCKKDISRCCPPSSPSPSSSSGRRRSRKSRSYYRKLNDDRHKLMMTNVIL